MSGGAVTPTLSEAKGRGRSDAAPVAAAAFAVAIAAAADSSGPAWLTALRRAGAEHFAATGLPGSKDEEWRFTPVAPMARVDWAPTEAGGSLAADAVTPYDFDATWPLVVLVDGHLSADLSRLAGLPAGVQLLGLADAIEAGLPEVADHLGKTADPAQTPFTALNAAGIQDGLFFHVPAGVQVATPVQLLHLTTEAAADRVASPRLLVLVGDNARCTVVESYASLAETRHVTNTVAEVVVGRNAWVEQIRIQRESGQAWHIGFTQVDQQRDSHYRAFALAMGGHLARHNLHARLGDENIETLMYGLYLTRGEQLADTHSAIFHDHPHCNSWEVYKGVLADASRAVFNGKVFVEPIAQKTDAKQTNRNLLLSDRAKVDTKPQLEIFADDVKCTHGATVGKLDEQQRYYLRTRGIGGRKAEQLLIWAFAAEVLAEITQPVVRARLEQVVHARLDEMTA